VVNRNTSEDRSIELSVRPGTSWLDIAAGEVAAFETDRMALKVWAGGFRLLALRP